jgi:AcrR family transcriptional regulator
MRAAEALFADNSFDAASVESIAGEAGVNKALIYYYFKGKKDIIRALFLGIISELNDHLKMAEPTPETPVGLTEMKEKIRRELQFLEERGRIITIRFMEALKGGDRDGFLFQCADLVIKHELEAFREALSARRCRMRSNTGFLNFLPASCRS